jgi:AraC-like DNA-binding protein
MSGYILTGILIFGAAQALFFALLFFTKEKRSWPDIIMGLWLVFLAVHILLIGLVGCDTAETGVINAVKLVFTVLHGPFLYIYTRLLTSPQIKFRFAEYLHFLPFDAFLLLALLFHFFKGNHFAVLIKVFALSGTLSGLIYAVFTLLLVQKHKKKLVHTFSFTEKINLNWLLHLSAGILLIWTGAAVAAILYRFGQVDLPIKWFFVIVPLFIFYIGFYGIKQKVIYSETGSALSGQGTAKKPSPGNKEIYKKSGLDTEKMTSVFKKLEKAMNEEKPYLNPELSLPVLAQKLEIPAHHITQTLNEYARVPFYDYINRYRTEAFKHEVMAPKNKNYSLLAVAYDCGFNSKSTFNRIFKKFTGKSPSEYKNSAL